MPEETLIIVNNNVIRFSVDSCIDYYITTLLGNTQLVVSNSPL